MFTNHHQSFTNNASNDAFKWPVSSQLACICQLLMTELESTIVKELVEKSLVKLYMKYVDDALLLVKDKDINHVHKRLNSFNRNIKFTVGTFLERTFVRY